MRISRRGQSLIEILVALALGVSFINVGILAMTTTNFLARINKANSYALSLLKSQSSILETISENGWHSIADLTIGKHYKLAKQNNSWVIQQGEEKVFDEKPPVAQWNLDEGSGTTAYDGIATNNGTFVSTPTWQTAPDCVNGSCLSFDGVDDYVNLGADTSVQVSSKTTIMAWVKMDTYNSSTSRYIFGRSDFVIYSDSGSTDKVISLKVSNGTSYYPRVVDVMPLNEWHNLAVTYDGTLDSNNVVTYFDGVKQYATTVTGSLSSPTSTWYIGGKSSGWGFFDGMIDDVRIYDYALTDSQVKQHYNAGLNRLGLVSQWGLDEGSGTITYDSQGANNGTLVNSPTWQTKANCVSGNCLGFNGSSNYVDAGNGANLNMANAVTLSAWLKFNGTQDWNTVVGKGFEQSANYSFEVNSNWIRLTAGNGTLYAGTDKYYPAAGQWFCITGVFTTIGSQTKLDMYINGALYKTITLDWPLTVSAANFGIGRSDYATSFNGSIDDVRIYNRALSADEITNQYKDGYTKYFYVNNVSRDIASDPTASTHNLETTYNANNDDPNTKKIINITRYLQGPSGRVNSEEQYLARVANINSLIQTDWSGASGVDGPEIDFGNNYSSASNLTLSTIGQMSLASTASNGSSTSSVIDTQSISGAGYFNILWQGDALCTGCSVKFQIAASNSQSGPWTYYGPKSTSDYYIPNAPNLAVPITYAGQYSASSASVQNKRYIRYQITLVPASSQTPVVKDVIINYAP